MGSAYNPRVREAARTILAYYIGQPSTIEKASRYGPEAIGDSQYLLEQQEYLSAEMGLIFGAAMSLAIMLGAQLLWWLVSGGARQYLSANPIVQVVAALMNLGFVGAAVWYLYRTFRQRGRDYRNFRAGREAEEATLEKLRGALDHRWTISRNLQLTGHKDDVDLALVGPAGVRALEVKNYRQPVRLLGPQWEVLLKGWKPMRDNPTAQVTRNATALSRYLKQYGITRYVHGAVVLQGPHPVSNFKPSDPPVWVFNTLDDKIAGMETNKPPSDKELEQIVEAMKQLAKR